MLQADIPKLEKLQRDLLTYQKKAFPFAVRFALNDSAVYGRRVWHRIVGEKLVIRNTWTQRGIQYEKVRGSNDVDRMESFIGSIRDYMAKLETGGTVTDTRGVPIHTTVASGEGRGVRPRKRVVKPGNRLNRLRRERGRFGSQKQRNAEAIRKARRSKARNKAAYLELGRTRGLYRVSGGKGKVKIDLLIDLTRLQTKVGPHPTLRATLDEINPKLIDIHALHIIKQLRRHGLFE